MSIVYVNSKIGHITVDQTETKDCLTSIIFLFSLINLVDHIDMHVTNKLLFFTLSLVFFCVFSL